MIKRQIASPIWSVESQVERGQQQGRKIGFPTANLEAKLLDKLHENVATGVYAALVTWRGNELLGASYYGPSFSQSEVINQSQYENVLEVHLLNFYQQIYGQKLILSAYQFIRPPIKFGSLSQLQTQIASDINQVKAWYTEFLKS